MASMLTDLAKPILEKLINATIAETSYICCFKCIVADFGKEKENLKAERDTIVQHIDAARRKGDGILVGVDNWVKQADELIAEDTTKEPETCFLGWCPNCKWRYRRGKELADKKKEIDKLMVIRFPSVGIARPLPDIEYHSSQDYIPFSSRESKYEELLAALRDDNNYITGLHGMGGAGKTTLAIKVGKELKKDNQFPFDYVVITTVSCSPDIKKIQDDIAASLGLKWEDSNESERPKKLWSRLTGGDKILVILDDIWGHINFGQIGIPYRDNHNRCRVLLTTRNESVCRLMECQKIIQLDLLSEEDAWTLFKNHAGISDNSPKDLLEKGHEIAKECKGLPIAIAVIASTLKDEHDQEEEWEKAFRSLTSPMDGVDESVKKIYKCLQYSYDNNNNHQAKKLFLLCSMFPEDEEIHIETLARLGIGVGLFGEVDEKYNAAQIRRQVVKATKNLMDSCLLLKAKKDRVKMHDLVREAALWIAGENIQSVDLSNKIQKLRQGIHMDALPGWFDGSNLEILIVYLDKDYMQVHDSFFENMTELRVLHLLKKGLWYIIQSLPQSIRALTKIRSLKIEEFFLGDISILGTLRSLETLDLYDCFITELPCEITELEKLRLLALDHCRITRKSNPFKVIERCSSIKELYFEDVRVDFPLEDADEPEPNHQNGTFPELQRYRLIKGRGIDSKYSRCFCLPDIDGLISEAGFKYLVEKAEVVELKDIKGEWRNLIPDIVPIDKRMNELYLSNCSKLQCLIDTKHAGNSHIQNVFSSLKTMVLSDCPMLVSVFQISISGSLEMLEELSITNCEQLKNIITDEKTGKEAGDEISDVDYANKSRASMFPNLKRLKLHSVPNFKPEIFSIDKCMNDLVELDLSSCSNLQCLIDTRDADNFHIQNGFSKLARLELEKMDNLEELCNGPLPSDCLKSLEWLCISDCEHLRSILFKNELKLSSLKTIELSDCPMLVSLFEISTSQSLVLLEELRIHRCSQLKNIITDEKTGKEAGDEIAGVDYANKSRDPMFPKLKTITIRTCHLLEFILPFLSARDVPLLEAIFIDSCDKLKYIFGKFQHEQEVKDDVLRSLKKVRLNNVPNFMDIFPECDHPMSSSVKRSSSQDGSKAQIQSDPPIKCNIFNWCHAHKNRQTRRSATNTNISLVPKDQQQDYSNSSLMNSECHLWKRAQCLFKQSQILSNIKDIVLYNLLKIKSIFILSFTPTMVLETLIISKCGELKQIIIDVEDDHRNCDNRGVIFPKLKELVVNECEQLEFIFGHYPHDHNNHNHNEIHLQLPALKSLRLSSLPNLISICPEKYRTTLPALTEFKIKECSQLIIKSIGDLMIHSDLRQLGSPTSKDLSTNVKHFLTLKVLQVENSKVENICGANEQQMTLQLCPVGYKCSFTLRNLRCLSIVQCEKLEVIFSSSILKCFPQLKSLVIIECKELKQIIDQDVENQKMSKLSPETCFPKLTLIVVQNCNKLKCIFPFFISKELHELKYLIIIEAPELEEVFKCEQGEKKVELPTLEYLLFVQLASLCQEIELQNPKGHCVHNCPKLCSTSSSAFDILKQIKQDIRERIGDYMLHQIIEGIIKKMFQAISTDKDVQETEDVSIQESSTTFTIGRIPSTNSTIKQRRILRRLRNKKRSIKRKLYPRENLNSYIQSQTKNTSPGSPGTLAHPQKNINGRVEEGTTTKNVLLDEQSMGESDLNIAIPTDEYVQEIEDLSFQEGSISLKIGTTISSTNLETRNTSPGPLLAPSQKNINRSVEEGTTPKNGEITTFSFNPELASSSSGPLFSSERKTYPQENVDGQNAIPSFPVATTQHPATKDVDVRDSHETSEFTVALTETHAQVSLDGNASMKVSSITKKQFCYEDGVGVSESKASPITFESPSLPTDVLPFKGNHSRIKEDFGFATLVTRELEQLVSNKHLASENLTLLTDFLVKHPSSHLAAGSSKYKGFAYNCLAELLKFLQTYSAMDVLESSRSHFVALLEDVCSFPFDKDWLDDVEKRALSPTIPLSQDSLQKLLYSKQHAEQEIEELRLKVGILTQQVEDVKHHLASSEAILESIVQQEAQVLEARAALSIPLGY